MNIICRPQVDNIVPMWFDDFNECIQFLRSNAPHKEFIYFLCIDNESTCKIGWSNSIIKRLKSHQSKLSKLNKSILRCGIIGNLRHAELIEFHIHNTLYTLAESQPDGWRNFKLSETYDMETYEFPITKEMSIERLVDIIIIMEMQLHPYAFGKEENTY